mgnify:FL=1
MSERMNPLPFKALIEWMLCEKEASGAVFGVSSPYVKKDAGALMLFGEKLEAPFGPAAGPNTQLAENIIAGYYAGARFFELKTVQKMDGEELAACISRPCILANDECYNCEWSTELTVPQAFEEYVKAYLAIKLIAKLYDLGDPEGFQFNMSVGYDLAGIKTEKIDAFIEGMKDASSTPIWAECMAELNRRFPEMGEYFAAISPRIATGVTVSTLHGCPPDEIEAIASYLIREKGLNTFVKCNPTILGYDFARERLNKLGYDYIAFDEHHFNEDLQYTDAVPMFHRLMQLAKDNGVEFGLKLSNTFPVDVKANELPSEEMYMSGRALYPLTIEMAARFSREFEGRLRLSFSGGADCFNIVPLYEAGIWPITVATTILKPGGYSRFKQLGELFDGVSKRPYAGVNAAKVAKLSADAETDAHYKKPVKPLPDRKNGLPLPLADCFTAPCMGGCPIHQDVSEYIELVEKQMYPEALELILEKNPLPFITGTICAHRCMDKCTRNFYEDSVYIRNLKLIAAQKGYDAVIARLAPAPAHEAKKTAIIGAGPAGIAAAYFIAREGYPVTVFEKENEPGGIVKNVIPEFRIASDAIAKDVALAKRMGAEFICGKEAPSLYELKAEGYEYILLATGAQKHGALSIQGNVMNVIDFLYSAKNAPETLALGNAVAVIGGGNTAMDAARAAKRMGVEKVSIVYRRTRKYMPADEEELVLATEDGVEFAELLAPVEQKDGMLVCKKMKLGELDESGRRSVTETDETVTIPADTVIAAVGEKPDAEALRAYGAEPNENGRVPFDCGAGVYAAGDALRGPATVVEAIADARRFADAVIGFNKGYMINPAAARDYRETLARKHKLMERQCGEAEAKRCLGCSTVCENCVSSCPNRANAAIKVKGKAQRQIVHIDALCNECGNCAVFCPYSGRPYKDKLTVFADEASFTDSENNGFLLIDRDSKTVKLRLNGEVSEVCLTKPNQLERDIEAIMLTVINDYGYML